MGSLSSTQDRARFQSVVMPHLADAFALARWLTGDRTDAEDVVQDACLRAFRGIGGFAGANARAWVLTIVRHTAYTWLAKNRSAALVMVDDLAAIEERQGGGGGPPLGAGGGGPRPPPPPKRRDRPGGRRGSQSPRRRGVSPLPPRCRCRSGRRWC